MIDMSLMKRVKVDSMKKTLWAEGGARWMDVIPHVEAHNLAYVGGECRQVGVVGIALGGGTGWLSRYGRLKMIATLSIKGDFHGARCQILPNYDLYKTCCTYRLFCESHIIWNYVSPGAMVLSVTAF